MLENIKVLCHSSIKFEKGEVSLVLILFPPLVANVCKKVLQANRISCPVRL